MSGNQSGKTANKTASKTAKKSNSGRIALIGAGGTALGVINIMSNGPEAPSQGLLLLQYGALALGLIALAGGLIMMATAPK